MADKAKTGLDLLRQPFAANHISKLPKPTKRQTDEVKANFKVGIRCNLCGAWHHPDVVHLDYVGHAALTDRLLDADPNWSWEPVAFRDGLPAFDQTGGLWIRLTVCGVTRLGYGHAAGKPSQDPGAREKEVIGDALRNAAMRFGAALDLWHKGDLHGDAEDNGAASDEAAPQAAAKKPKAVPKHEGETLARETFARLSAANSKLPSIEAHGKFWTQDTVRTAIADLPLEMKQKLAAEKATKLEQLSQVSAAGADTVTGEVDDDAFPGDLNAATGERVADLVDAD